MLDALDGRMLTLTGNIDQLKRKVATRTDDGRSAVATELVAATHRLDRQRAAAVHALQFARTAAASQWAEVLARVEGHLQSTEASYQATVAQLAR